jgi:hypothetical protein
MALVPPDGDAAPTATHERQVVRENEQTGRHHPEPEDRQKTETATTDQGGSGEDSTATGAWKGNFEACENQSATFCINPVSALCQCSNSLHFRQFSVFLPPPRDGKPTE